MEPLPAHSEREWILVGMAECCATQGFEEAAVADICAEAGVPETSFGRLFNSKEDCLAAAVESVVAEAERRIAARCSPVKSWAANVRTGAWALLGLLAERPTFAHAALIEAPAAGGRAAELHAIGKAALLSYVERGADQADPDDGVPASAGRAALAGAEALTISRLLNGDAGQLGRLAPDVIYMLTVPYLGRSEALRVADAPRPHGHLRAVA